MVSLYRCLVSSRSCINLRFVRYDVSHELESLVCLHSNLVVWLLHLLGGLCLVFGMVVLL